MRIAVTGSSGRVGRAIVAMALADGHQVVGLDNLNSYYDPTLKQARLDQLGGEKKQIAFGSQIRSYVLQPYQMVKDLRTRFQVGDVNRVLDGDLDDFIKAYLMQKALGKLSEPAEAEDE